MLLFAITMFQIHINNVSVSFHLLVTLNLRNHVYLFISLKMEKRISYSYCLTSLIDIISIYISSVSLCKIISGNNRGCVLKILSTSCSKEGVGLSIIYLPKLIHIAAKEGFRYVCFSLLGFFFFPWI
jgi:hypothetical protein